MTLQTFLFTVFGKQEKGGQGEDKKLEMEILQEIGMQRFVRILFQACSIKFIAYLSFFLAFLNLNVSLSLHVCYP